MHIIFSHGSSNVVSLRPTYVIVKNKKLLVSRVRVLEFFGDISDRYTQAKIVRNSKDEPATIA